MAQFDQAELASLTEVASSVARKVGTRIRELRSQGVNVAATKSSLVDVVTEADREAEWLIAELLSEARPNDGLLGEEGASTEGSTGITWVVDPIDGTINYLYGLPTYAVSIAATVSTANPATGDMADGRRAIAGAVYVPVTDELYTAHEGGGAWLNESQLHVSTEEDLSLALVGTGFGYTVERRTEQAEAVRQLIPQVRDIRRIGSAANDLCLVAAGRLDVFYEHGLQPWDYAAGALIAREAGALILGRDNETLPGEPLLFAGPPTLVRKLQAVIQDTYGISREQHD